MATRDCGFTLIEMMMVIGIIAILAALAVPNLFEARKAANEVAAIGSLKSIATAQSLFRESDKDKNGKIDYGTLSALGSVNVLDSILATGTKAGYYFSSGPATATANTKELMFWSIANPVVLDGTGNRSYCTNQQGVIFYTQQMLVSSGSLLTNAVIPPEMRPVR